MFRRNRILAVLVVLALSLTIVIPAVAAGFVNFSALTLTTCTPGGTLQALIDINTTAPGAYTLTTSVNNLTRGGAVAAGLGLPAGLQLETTLTFFGGVPAGTEDGDTLLWEMTTYHNGVVTSYDEIAFNCATGEGVAFGDGGIPADTFLSDVCEPNNGFSGDGWQTWNTNARQHGRSPVLYASSDGSTWHMVSYPGAPWVFNQTALNAIANQVGAHSYTDMWFRTDHDGKPVHVGNAIAERAGRMNSLCGQ